jgi:hypothetical protein
VENQDSDPRLDAAAGPGAPIFPFQSIFETLGSRQSGEHTHDHDHGDAERMPGPMRPHAERPRSSTIVHVEGPGFSYSSTRSVDPGNEMVVDLISTMFRNIVGDGAMPERTPAGADGQATGGNGTPPGPQRTERSERPRMTPYAAAFIPSGRLNPRDANSAQASPDQQVIDLPTYAHSYRAYIFNRVSNIA